MRAGGGCWKAGCMLIEHEGRRPQVHPSAYVAPTAVLSGDVRVGPACQVLFGAVLTDDGGPVVLGGASIVMENAVLRGTSRDPVRLGAHVLVGPRAYLVGADVDDEFWPPVRRCSTAPCLGAAVRFGSTGWCTCARCYRPGRWCRSAGSPSENRR